MRVSHKRYLRWSTMAEGVYVAVGLSLCGGYSTYIMIVCYQAMQVYTGT